MHRSSIASQIETDCLILLAHRSTGARQCGRGQLPRARQPPRCTVDSLDLRAQMCGDATRKGAVITEVSFTISRP